MLPFKELIVYVQLVAGHWQGGHGDILLFHLLGVS